MLFKKENMWRTINLTSSIPYSDSFVTWGSHKQIRITRMPTELIYTFSMAFVSCFFCLVMIIKQSMIYLYTCYTLNQYISSTVTLSGIFVKQSILENWRGLRNALCMPFSTRKQKSMSNSWIGQIYRVWTIGIFRHLLKLW